MPGLFRANRHFGTIGISTARKGHATMNIVLRALPPGSLALSMVILVVGLFSLLKGLRFPNIWSYTHYLFNYDYGLVKRGLIGALANGTGIELLSSYRFFCLLSFAILLLCMLLLFRLIFAAVRLHGYSSIVVALVFLSSVSLLYLSHTVGYFDQIGLLFTLVVLSFKSFPVRFWLGVAGTIFCVFVHEAFLVLYFPVIFVSLLRDCLPGRWHRLILLSIFAAATLGTTWHVTNLVLPEDAVHQAYVRTQQTTPIVLREDAFDVQFRSGPDNAEIMGRFWSEPMRWLQLFNCLVVTIPSIAVIAFFTQFLLQSRRESAPARILVMLAAVSPLILNIVAWDMERFAALAVLTSFLVYLVVAVAPAGLPENKPVEDSVEDRTDFASAAMLVALGVVILNFNSSILLFDGYVAAQFPFPEISEHLVRALFFGDRFFSIPAI